jgi:hypothetical protein
VTAKGTDGLPKESYVDAEAGCSNAKESCMREKGGYATEEGSDES